jgi:hypothetical protein
MRDSVRDMNHNVTLAIVAIVAATTLTTVVFAVPQQASAYRHHNHHNQNNILKVDQQVNQQNSCTGIPVVTPELTPGVSTISLTGGSVSDGSSVSGTVCLNSGDNTADIHK